MVSIEQLLHCLLILYILYIRIGIYSIVLPGSRGWHFPLSLQTSATLYLVSMLDRRVLYWQGKGIHQALDQTETFSNYLFFFIFLHVLSTAA